MAKKPNINLIYNKKGSGLIDTLGTLIQGITNIMPKPVLFIIFLFILALATYLISVILLITGTFCNSANQPVILNTNFLQNTNLLTDLPDPSTIGQESLNLPETTLTSITPQVTQCTKQIQKGTIYYNESTKLLINPLQIPTTAYEILTNPPNLRLAQNFTEPLTFYDGTFCTNCQQVTVCDIVGSCNKVCVGNVQRIPDDKKGFTQKMFCGNIGCEPPQHYFYNQKLNTYLCQDNTCAGMTQGKKWDELLASKGAVLKYPEQYDASNPTGANALGVTCQDLKPRFAIYGIDFFNFQYWLIITLIILVWFIIYKISTL